MKNRGVLISFIGIDGSGKTTLANTLNMTMKEYGIRSKYIYGRFTSVILKILVEITKKLLSFRGKNMSVYDERVIIKNQILRSRVVSRIYQSYVFLNYISQIFIKVNLPLMFNKNIVCDRYVYDSVVDLAIDFHYTGERLRGVLSQYLRFVPRPDCTFLIDLPEDIAFRRGKEDIPSVAFLSDRRGIYLEMSKWYEMTILDGEKDLQELREIVKSAVFTKSFHKGKVT
ncbi:MAG: dTMP kinase [Candidatus Hodarchaeota archaeon]